MRRLLLIFAILFWSAILFYCHAVNPTTPLLGVDLRAKIFNDSLVLWDLFRDPDNGVYCDTIRFPSGTETPVTPCGPSNNFYSSAGTGKILSITVMTMQS